MTQREITPTATELVAAPGKWLHRKDSDIYVPKAPVATADIGMWEEVDERPAHTEGEYRAEVERRVALRYTTGQEIQFAREKEEAGEKYAEYLEYVGRCKQEARQWLASRAGEAESSTTETDMPC